MLPDSLLGFTEYEGRLYRALLQENPATAYRLGKLCGVPLSRVYEVADRLVAKGAAARLPGEPARYAPVPPNRLIERARVAADRSLTALNEELTALWSELKATETVWLRGEAGVLARIQELDQEAATELLAACTPLAERPLRGVLGAGRLLEGLPGSGPDDASFVVLVVRGPALIGRLGGHAEALFTSHPALTRLCQALFSSIQAAHAAEPLRPVAVARSARPSDRPGLWLDWEEAKAQRLLSAH